MPILSPTSSAFDFTTELKDKCKILEIADSGSHYDIINTYSGLAVSVEEAEDFLQEYEELLDKRLRKAVEKTTKGGKNLLNLLLFYFDGLVGRCRGGISMTREVSLAETTDTLESAGGAMDLAVVGAGFWNKERMEHETRKASMQREALEFLLSSATCALVRKCFILLYTQTPGASSARDRLTVTSNGPNSMPRRKPLPFFMTKPQDTKPSPQATSSQAHPFRSKSTSSTTAFQHPQMRKAVFQALQRIKPPLPLHLSLLNQKPRTQNQSPPPPYSILPPPWMSLPLPPPLPPPSSAFIPPTQSTPASTPTLSPSRFKRIKSRFWNSVIDSIDAEIKALVSRPLATDAETKTRNKELWELVKGLEDICGAQKALDAEFVS